jgi:hypothetical protein
VLAFAPGPAFTLLACVRDKSVNDTTNFKAAGTGMFQASASA